MMAYTADSLLRGRSIAGRGGGAEKGEKGGETLSAVGMRLQDHKLNMRKIQCFHNADAPTLRL